MDFLQVLTPFLLASIGGLYTEYSGTTHVALEGYITFAAFIYITVSRLTGSPYYGMILALLIVEAVSFLHAYFTVKIKANPIITGLAVNMGLFGIISTLSFKIFKTKGVILLETTQPIDTTPLSILAILLPFITLLVLSFTRYGLRLKVSGLSKKSLIYSGIQPDYYRVSAMMITSLLAGLAGIFLGMELRSFIPNIGAGRGWISLVIIYLGRKHPIGILLGCILFSITQMISNFSQSQAIPADIILASPYVITLIALILTSKSRDTNL